MSSKGKKYLLLPPILFPQGSESKRDIFLNPAVVRVSGFLQFIHVTRCPEKTQVLKVMLFGPSSLQPVETDGKTSGPKPAAIKWGVRRVTAGAIAFAAIIVSAPLTMGHFPH
jgi:hypothetical protein